MRKIKSLFLIICLLSLPVYGQEPGHPCYKVREILSRTESIRGLHHVRPYGCQALNEEHYHSFTAALTKRHNRIQDLQFEELVWKQLGIIPPNYPYAECAIKDGGDNTTAMYDIDSKTMIFRGERTIKPSIVAHELVHMLQDQKYNLQKLASKRNSTEEVLALEALTEGDAVTSAARYGEDFASEEGPSIAEIESDDGCKPSEPLQSILLFPYEWGTLFVSEILKSGGSTALEDAFRRPPTTARMVLYPQEFIKKIKVDNLETHFLIPRPLKSKVVYKDSLGEYILRALLKSVSSMSEGVLAAKGLVFDTTELIAMDTKNLYRVSWVLKFQSASEIEQLRPVMAKLLLKVAQISVEPKAKEWDVTSSDGNRWAFKVSGASCELIHDFTEDDNTKVPRAPLKS